MSKYSAPSDYDYQDVVEGCATYRRDDDQPTTVQAVCRSCGGWFEHDPQRPELLCRACLAVNELTALLAKDRGAA